MTEVPVWKSPVRPSNDELIAYAEKLIHTHGLANAFLVARAAHDNPSHSTMERATAEILARIIYKYDPDEFATVSVGHDFELEWATAKWQNTGLDRDTAATITAISPNPKPSAFSGVGYFENEGQA